MCFVYSLESLKTIQASLSPERMTAYLIFTRGDTRMALALYEENTRLSEGLYGVIQGLEIAARNSIHRSLIAGIGSEDWYDHVSLQTKEQASVQDAKAKLARWKKPETPGRLVAELTFGFWVRLLAPGYEKQLWVPHLHKAFPQLPKPNRVATFDRFERIRKLRNRIAHHEPIFKQPLNVLYEQIIEATNWVCPVTAAWINSTNSFVHRRFR